MVRDVSIDGGSVAVTIALDRARLPAPGELPGAGRAAGAPGARGRARQPRLRRHDARREGGAHDEAPRRRHRAHARDLGRRLDAHPRGRERQGRRRQVVLDRQPRRGARNPGAARRCPRRGHLRVLDSAHARRPSAARRGRSDDRPAGPRRPEGHVDRLLPRRQRTDHVAGPDAAQGPRAVPLGRPLGRARLAGGRHAAGHGRRLDLARPAPPAGRGRGRHHPAARGAGGRGSCGRDGSEDEHAPARRGREHVLPRRQRRAGLRRGRRRGARGRDRRAAHRPHPARPGARSRRGRGRSHRPARSRGGVRAAILAVAEAIHATPRELGVGITKTLPLVGA